MTTETFDTIGTVDHMEQSVLTPTRMNVGRDEDIRASFPADTKRNGTSNSPSRENAYAVDDCHDTEGVVKKPPFRRNTQEHHNIEQKNRILISRAEAMNPSRRSTMEDRVVVLHCSEWKSSHSRRRRLQQQREAVPPPGSTTLPSHFDSRSNFSADLTYIGVYDGHGGSEIVDFLVYALSHHIAEELQGEQHDVGQENVCNEENTMEDMTTCMERAFIMTDLHARQCGILTSGAAVAVCLLERDHDDLEKIYLTAANVGDTRVILAQDGRAVRLTKDHRCDDPLEVSRIHRDGGFIFKGRVMGVLAVTRSLGDHALKKYVIAHPHVHEQTIELCGQSSRSPSTFLIVACDGLWDVMTDQEAVDLVSTFAGRREDVASYLVAQSLNRGTSDNVSVCVAFLS